MRIAIFTEIYKPCFGSCVSSTYELNLSLQNLGHETLIVAPNPIIYNFELKDNVLYCPSKKYNSQYGFTISEPLNHNILNYIAKFKPDIIHITTSSPMGKAGLNVATNLNLPIVFTVNERLEVKQKFNNLTSYKSVQLNKKLLNKSNFITAPYDISKLTLQELNINEKFNTVFNAVNVDIFDYNKVLPVNIVKLKDKYKIRNASLICIFCAHITKQKKVQNLIEAWAKHLKNNKDIILFVVGDGPYLKEIMDLTYRLNIKNQVIFSGKLNRDELPNIYSMADIYLSACTDDTYSMSVLEANACGLPVVLPANSINNLQIKEGISGFTFKDDYDLIKYIKSFNILDIESRKILKKLVRRTATKNSVNNFAKNMVKVYFNAIKSNDANNSNYLENNYLEKDESEEEFVDISNMQN